MSPLDGIRNLGLRTKQLLGFGFVLLLLAVTGFASVARMSLIHDDLEAITGYWLPRMLALSEVESDALALQNSQLNYALADNDDERNVYAGQIAALIDSINVQYDAARSLDDGSVGTSPTMSTDSTFMRQSEQQWESYLDLTGEFIGLSLSNERERALDLLNGDLRVVFEELSGALDAQVQDGRAAAVSAAADGEQTYLGTRRLILMWVLIALVASALMAFWLVRLITRPIQELDTAAGLVADGNLEVELRVQSGDEVGRLTQSFNRMTSALKAAWERNATQQRQLEKTNSALELQKVEIEKQHADLGAAHNKLQAAQQQLVESEKMASVGQLTAGIAHEINNPINFVSSNVSPLRRDVEDVFRVMAKYDDVVTRNALTASFEEVHKLKEELDYDLIHDEIGELLVAIEEGTSRTAEIVRGLRSFSRLDEAEQKMADVNEGLRSTLMLVRSSFGDRIHVETTFGDVPEIPCYPGRLNQVFMNLLVNATQAIPGDGHIYVTTSSRPGEVTISIRDTGEGIPEKAQEHIFEPFFTTKDVGEGTGLGLSIVHGIIADHSGTIELESTVGVGTEFIITLPTTDQA